MYVEIQIPPLTIHYDIRVLFIVKDTPQEWRLPDGEYQARVIEWHPHHVLLEIIGGPKDGERYQIDSPKSVFPNSI